MPFFGTEPYINDATANTQAAMMLMQGLEAIAAGKQQAADRLYGQMLLQALSQGGTPDEQRQALSGLLTQHQAGQPTGTLGRLGAALNPFAAAPGPSGKMTGALAGLLQAQPQRTGREYGLPPWHMDPQYAGTEAAKRASGAMPRASVTEAPGRVQRRVRDDIVKGTTYKVKGVLSQIKALEGEKKRLEKEKKEVLEAMAGPDVPEDIRQPSWPTNVWDDQITAIDQKIAGLRADISKIHSKAAGMLGLENKSPAKEAAPATQPAAASQPAIPHHEIPATLGTATEPAAAAEPIPEDPSQLVKGKLYRTPAGKIVRFTGTDFELVG